MKSSRYQFPTGVQFFVVRSMSMIGMLVLGGSLFNSALAQTDGGLTLGQPEVQEAPKLDLGAPAPADKPLPQTDAPASQPLSSKGLEADPSGVTRIIIGAWEVACPAEGINCAMAQVGNDASGTPVLEMVVRKLDEPLEVGERTAIAVLDVITPLGVVLTEGLSVQIDGGRQESAPFQICTEQGCLVREPIDDGLVARFKKGNSAIVSVVAANQGEVKATLSLVGFTKAFNDLK